MLIGFAMAMSEGRPDAEILRGVGCERIFSVDEGVFAIEDIIQYLRPGDVLAIADLSRLGGDLDRLIQLLERLHHAGVRVLVAGTDIVPDTSLGESFTKACCILAEFSRSQHDSTARPIRGRGRPVALPPELRVRAERMLKDGSSVAEIARVFKVSSATLYRYFPGASRALKIQAKGRGKTPRSRRQNERPTASKR